MATFNVNTLRGPARINELVKYASNLQLDAVSVQEHRRILDPPAVSPQTLQLAAGWRFVFSSADRSGQGGVGVLLAARLFSALQSVHEVSPRILALTFHGASADRRHWPPLVLVACYAPPGVAATPTPAAESFFADLSGYLSTLSPFAFVVLLGDLNARLPRGPGAPWAFQSTYDVNGNTTAMQELLSSHHLFSANSAFQKRNGKLWTHVSPDSKHFSQLDHIVVRCRYRNSVRDAEVYSPAPVPGCQRASYSFKTDHRIVIARLRLSLRAPRRAARPPRFQWDLLDSAADVRRQFVAVVRSSLARAAVQRPVAPGDLPAEPSADVLFGEFKAAVLTARAVAPIPEVPPRSRRVPWLDTDVTARRAELEAARIANRCIRTDASRAACRTAALRLTEQYTASQQRYIAEQVRAIESAAGVPASLTPSAWRLINDLTGGRPQAPGHIPAASPAARLMGWQRHFSVLLNNNFASAGPFRAVPVHVPAGGPEYVLGPFSLGEVARAAKALRPRKACGLDTIPAEVLRLPELHPFLLAIFNAIYTSGTPPAAFLQHVLVPVPKKGDLSQYDNYRGITLLPVAVKLYNRMLLNRIRDPIERLLRPSQHGFRRGRCTLEPILILRRLIEIFRQRKGTARLVAVFIDFTKAFDSIHRARMFAILAAYGVPDELIRAIRCLYTGTTCFVQTTDGNSAPFTVETGVLQGDTLAPFLFILVMDYALRQAFPPGQECSDGRTFRPAGIRLGSSWLTETAFADDVALLGMSVRIAEEMVAHLEAAAGDVGLRVSSGKSKFLVTPQPPPPPAPVAGGGAAAAAVPRQRPPPQPPPSAVPATLSSSWGPIGRVANFCYLGSMIASSASDLTARQAQAWRACDRLWKVWKSPLADDLKRRLFRVTVLPVLLYGCETWVLTRAKLQSLDGCVTRMLRKALRVPWGRHVTNVSLYGSLPRASAIQLERQLRYLGHARRFAASPVAAALQLQPDLTLPRRRGAHSTLTLWRALTEQLGFGREHALHVMNDRDEWRKLVAERFSARRCTT